VRRVREAGRQVEASFINLIGVALALTEDTLRMSKLFHLKMGNLIGPKADIVARGIVSIAPGITRRAFSGGKGNLGSEHRRLAVGAGRC
jgi:hypothetical protein